MTSDDGITNGAHLVTLKLSGLLPLGVDGRFQEGPSGPATVDLELSPQGLRITCDNPDDSTELPWADITALRVDPWGEPTLHGACLGFTTAATTHYLFINERDPQEISRQLEQIRSGQSTHESLDSGDHDPSSPPLQILLVVVLVVVLAVSVALILAQSAGVIHLPLLGSNGTHRT